MFFPSIKSSSKSVLLEFLTQHAADKLGSTLSFASWFYRVFSRHWQVTGLLLTCESAACDSRRRLFGSHGWCTPCVEDSALSDRDLWWHPDLQGETNSIFKWQKAGIVETCGGGKSTHGHCGGRSESNIKSSTVFFSFGCFCFLQQADSCVALTEAGRKIMSWRKEVRSRKNGKRHEVNVEFSTVLSCLMRTVLSEHQPHLLPNQSPTPAWRLWQQGTAGWCPGWQKIRAAHWLWALCHFTLG